MVTAIMRPRDAGATPSFVIDLATVGRNVAGLADHAGGSGLGGRPHTKTQKSLAVEYPGAAPARPGEEHGELDTAGAERGPKAGGRVTLIPNQISPCVNLQGSARPRHRGGTPGSIGFDSRGSLS